MRVIEVSAEDKMGAISEVSDILKRGGIAAYPTETFYGVGVKYHNFHALEKLYELKRRPKNRAMPLIIGDRKFLGLICLSLNMIEEKLIENFWPGPLTLLTSAREDLPELLTAGTGKIAVRIPGESFALALARSLDFPITATSANISGMPAAKNAENVIRYFGHGLDIVIDGGETRGGLPSTIVDASAGLIKIVRPGLISEEEIFEAVGLTQGKPRIQ